MTIFKPVKWITFAFAQSMGWEEELVTELKLLEVLHRKKGFWTELIWTICLGIYGEKILGLLEALMHLRIEANDLFFKPLVGFFLEDKCFKGALNLKRTISSTVLRQVLTVWCFSTIHDFR